MRKAVDMLASTVGWFSIFARAFQFLRGWHANRPRRGLVYRDFVGA